MINTLPQSLIESAKKILTESQHPMIDVDGDMKHRHNSEGRPIHHTDDGIRNFHRWFGSSKVVDEHGRPLVVYHGTISDFDRFDFDKSRENNTVWTTNKPSVASEFALYRTVWNNANVMPLYVKAHNIKEIEGNHNDIRDIDGPLFHPETKNEYSKYDAIHFKNVRDSVGPNFPKSSNIWAIHKTSQFKSAIGNNGDFHPDKPQINESEEPNEVDQFRQKWKDAGVDNFVYAHEGRDTIGLSSVIVPKHAQNQGHGTKYMQDLSNLADKLGKTVILTPSSDFGGTKTRLVKFYKSHGFVENKGRNKDFTISETMYRRPQEYKGQAPHQPEPISAPTEKPLAPIKDTVMSKHMKSPEFHKWFEGSKVKNGMGDPVIVYHGSPDMGKIEESGAFRHKDDGIFFTNDLKTAQSYTDEKRSTNYQEAKGGVIPAHLNIKNPYYHDHQGKDWFGTEKVIADAKEKGHDGVIINNVVDHYNTNRVKKVRPSTVYVVFNPKQIKHATKNNGKHSPETENIFE